MVFENKERSISQKTAIFKGDVFFEVRLQSCEGGLAGDTFFKVCKYCSGFSDFVAGGTIPAELCILADLVLDFFAGQKDGRMVFISHKSADF